MERVMDEETTLPEVDPGTEQTAETTEEVVTEESATSDETTEETTAEQPKKAKGVQKRLDEITRQRYEAERRAEQERQERIYWQKKAMGEDKPAVQTPVNKPSVDQYGTYEDYLEALSDWKVEQRLSAERQETERKAKEQETHQKATTYQERVNHALNKYEDYADVAHGNHWSPTPEMTDAILESDIGPDIAYYLGSNPEEAIRISRLSPAAQNRELGKLEVKLSAPPPVKRTTAAPPPIEPAGSKAKVQKDPADMSPSEFAKWRQQYINQRR